MRTSAILVPMPTRRKLFQAAAAPALLSSASAQQPENATVEENRRRGTLHWQTQYFLFDRYKGSGLRSPSLEGYASETSVYPGETIRFHVSTDPPKPFVIDLYRSGYYGGLGGRHMLQLGPFTGNKQSLPQMGMERVRECRWEASAELEIPDDWPSGVYLGKLSLSEERLESYCIFIVKSRGPADVLFQCSDLTWQAYNKWPGWDSLYDDGRPKLVNEYNYTGPNVRVSFDRPYARFGQLQEMSMPTGSGEYLLWEHPAAFWLEQQGYHVAYCSNLDAETDPDILNRAKVFLSIGHDEYWTRPMYRNIVAARDRGMSIAFLSGNAILHEIETYPSTVTGSPLRAFARKRLFAEDARNLLGATTYGTGFGDWTVRNQNHWIFSGTGVADGDAVPGLVGWEYHGPPLAEIPGLEVVASSDLVEYGKRNPTRKHAATIYPGKKNNWVFNAGTIWWSEGLSAPPGHVPATSQAARAFGPDERVQRITKNFLDRCLSDSKIRF